MFCPFIADKSGMKRDMDLIRAILLFAEEHCDGVHNYLVMPRNLPDKYHSVDKSVLTEHIVYAADEKGLIVVKYDHDGYSLVRLTSKGRRFLDNPPKKLWHIIRYLWTFIWERLKQAGNKVITDWFALAITMIVGGILAFIAYCFGLLRLW
jgi:hypothetical protein